MIWFLFSISVNAADKWTMADTAWQASATALMVGDWGQTRYIAQHPGEYHETNPILGRHPSTSAVDLYFMGALIVHPVISYLLPSKAEIFGVTINPRRIWQAGTIVVELGCVANNARLGIGFSF
jgi:hypothetical protein